MSSPQSTGDAGGVAGPSDSSHRKPLEPIAFRFCGECSNMLYPREDVEARKLMLTCRTCQYSEEAQTSCIYRNVLNNAVSETAGVTQDVASDPTVGALPVWSRLACRDASASAACVGAAGIGDRGFGGGGGGASAPAASEDTPVPDVASLCLGCGCVITCTVCGELLTDMDHNAAAQLRHHVSWPASTKADTRTPANHAFPSSRRVSSSANSTSSNSFGSMNLAAWMAEEEERMNDYLGEDEVDNDVEMALC